MNSICSASIGPTLHSYNEVLKKTILILYLSNNKTNSFNNKYKSAIKFNRF